MVVGIVLRSTFLHVDDDADALREEVRRGGGAARQPRRLPRPRSAPPPPLDAAGGGDGGGGGDGEGPDVFDGARAYVADLSERLAVMWSAAGVDEVLLSSSASAPAADLGAAASSRTAAAEGHGPAPAGAAAAPSWEDELWEGDPKPREGGAAATPPTSPGNLGSLGHPVLCSRPCLYFASGQCRSGEACDYCHAPHSKRSAHLDRRHRESLEAMSSSGAAAIALPVLQEKVLAFDASLEARRAFDRLAAACLGEAADAPERASKMCRSRDRMLRVALSAVSLRQLLLTLQRSVLRRSPEAQAAAQALLDQLRHAAAEHRALAAEAP